MKAISSLIASVFLSFGAATTSLCADSTTAATASSERPKIDLNTAEIPVLESIPEIGTNFANAVVASRPLKSVDDLERILKIGPEKMKTLREKVMVSPVHPVSPPAKSTDTAVTKDSKPPVVNDGKAIDRKQVSERYDRTVDPAKKQTPVERK